jgi:transposase
VAIEVPHGVVVETLMERGFPVYSINPKQLDRFRDRFFPAGAKDDSRDALVLADSLRTDRHCFRRLNIRLPQVVELREWSRMMQELRREQVSLSNRLREQLRRYYVQLLEITRDVDQDWFLDLWELAPTPAVGQRLQTRRLTRFLHEHRIRKVEPDALASALRQASVTVAAGTEAAAVAHVRLLVERLRIVNRQLKQCTAELERLCDALLAVPTADGTASESSPEHHDVTILRSLPGIGKIVLGMVLGEAWCALRARDYEALRALAGVAPITRQSGKKKTVVMRHACNPRLREATYHWARVSVQHDPLSRAKYLAMRSRGHSHGRALRGISDRLLNVACAMLRHGTEYNPDQRTTTALAEAA